MSDLRQLPSFCNFMMLTNKLHALFFKYINEGRNRAPPVADLADLVSSFQLGARTDRRALQSKFKSWARRMTVEDGRLKLASSNKEIIPLEKCDDVVMCLHIDGHKSVDEIISKIRERYTWTKKNFGMDRFMVMNYILINCTNFECKYQIEFEIKRRNCCDNFIKKVIFASESQTGMFQNVKQEGFPVLKNSMFNNYSSIYSWPFVFPFTADSIRNEVCFPYTSTKIEIKDIKSLVSKEDKPSFPVIMPSSKENEICNQLQKTVAKASNIEIQKPSGLRKKKFFKPSKTFRKPKNISEYKALLSAAEQLKEAYPSILGDPKTVFLGGLGLAPKKICSKRTLAKFEKEKKRKKIVERQHFLYHKNRKNLRDRNKLNKIKLKQEQEKRAYLDVSLSKKKLSNGTECMDSTVVDCDIEIVKVIPSKYEPEVILITSSDDEISGDRACAAKSKSFKDIDVVKSDFKGQSTSKGLERSEKDVEVIFNTDNSSRKDANALRLSSQYTQHPVLRKVLLPPNLKREIAVLPFSRYTYLKPPSQVHSASNQNVNLKTSVKGKDSILQPISDTNIGKKSFFFNKPSTGLQLPKSKFFLLKKTSNEDSMKMVSREQIDVTTSQAPIQLNRDCSIPVDVVINENTKASTTLLKEKVISLQKSYARTSHYSSPKNSSVHEEMSKLSKWIRKTKMTMVKTYFSQQVERSIRKLESELNVGITLIRSIRRKLLEVERNELKTSNVS